MKLTDEFSSKAKNDWFALVVMVLATLGFASACYSMNTMSDKPEQPTLQLP